MSLSIDEHGHIHGCRKCYKTPCCCSGHSHGHDPSLSHAHSDLHGHPHGVLAISGGCNKCHHNPCSCPRSTTCCETLPSQIENFTKSFFGTVQKSEVNGKIVWTLPCQMEDGLTNNPRFENEGVGCYILRLLEQGIVGLQGPEGNTGDAGADGNNAYSVTLASFAQPTSAAPNSQVLTAYNPAIFPGLTIFIQTSGYHFVNATDGNGTLFLTLIQAADGAPAVITAGKLVVSTGPQGTGPQGEQGIQGNPGEQGTPGVSFTTMNGQYHTFAGTDFPVQLGYGAVTFGASDPAVTLTAQGKYALTAVVAFRGRPGIVLGDLLSLKLRNASNLTDVEGSEQTQNNVVNNEVGSITLHALYETDSANQQVRLDAKSTTAGVFDIVADRTVLTFVRVA